MNHKVTVYEDLDWVQLARDMFQWRALMNAAKSLEPFGSIKCGYFLDRPTNYWFLKKTLLHGFSFIVT
jgi:hypothetical protein